MFSRHLFFVSQYCLVADNVVWHGLLSPVWFRYVLIRNEWGDAQDTVGNNSLRANIPLSTALGFGRDMSA